MANKVYFERFDNIYRFMDTITRRPNNNKFGTESHKNGSWSGTETYDEAVDQFTNGLPETAERMKKSLGAFKAQSNICTSKARPQNHYYGYTPNVPAAIIGLPKSMRRVQRIPQKTKTIGILMDCTQNCSFSADDLQKAGETVMQLVYALEVRGYRVKLDCIPFNANANGCPMFAVVNIKEFGQQLDILKLSFPITSPAMFRRFGFQWAETVPNFTGDRVWGYGSHMGKSKVLDVITANGYDTKSSYYICTDDCMEADFDPLQVAKNLGIIM